jgi:hypothetical protein
MAELRKIKDWLHDHYAMFSKNDIRWELYLDSLGEREVESEEEAWHSLNEMLDSTIKWLTGSRPLKPFDMIERDRCICWKDADRTIVRQKCPVHY